MSKHAWEGSCDGVDDDHCCEFASGEDVVSDGDFDWIESFDDTLVNPFIVACDHEQAGLRGECFDQLLREWLPLRGHVDPGCWSGIACFDGGDRIPDRLAHHDHAWPAAVRAIVGFAVFIVGVIADIRC